MFTTFYDLSKFWLQFNKQNFHESLIQDKSLTYKNIYLKFYDLESIVNVLPSISYTNIKKYNKDINFTLYGKESLKDKNAKYLHLWCIMKTYPGYFYSWFVDNRAEYILDHYVITRSKDTIFILKSLITQDNKDMIEEEINSLTFDLN